ncbi:hypothetical protein RJT34_17998 [Clitoria ternatea]|uniref:Uncharacterized protein n=1 Tax=Clitoria ternatea TaxID=43366 RepID=A0AAN9JB77_CLITE
MVKKIFPISPFVGIFFLYFFPIEIKISSLSFSLSRFRVLFFLSIHFCPSPTTANSLHSRKTLFISLFLLQAVTLNLEGAELFSIPSLFWFAV